MNDHRQMQVAPIFPPRQQQAPNPNPVAQRTAAAFAEIKKMEDTVNQLWVENLDLKRRLDAAYNKIDLLEKAKDEAAQYGKVCSRKLMRLATSMGNINLLTAEADKILRDAKEFMEVDKEAEAAAKVTEPPPEEPTTEEPQT